MLTAVLLFCVGLLCLVKGGDWFVDGAVGIARRFRLPDLLIGATVVSVGTTLPEVMISAASAVGGHGEIAYGNAIGSIICNAALVAAVTIAVRPGKADAAALRLPVGFFFVAAVFYAAVAYTTGMFSRWVGIVLLAMFAAYMAAQVAAARRAPAAPASGEAAEESAGGSLAVELVRLVLSAALIAAVVGRFAGLGVRRVGRKAGQGRCRGLRSGCRRRGDAAHIAQGAAYVLRVGIAAGAQYAEQHDKRQGKCKAFLFHVVLPIQLGFCRGLSRSRDAGTQTIPT